MKNTRWIVALALALLPAGAFAQARGTITGRVTDQANQQGLAGVQVIVVSTGARGTTDQQGTYRIPGVAAGQYQVSATRIGYETRTQSVAVAAGQTATANFALSASALELGGLVVTASGREQRTRELGNAVGNINVSEVELAAVPNVSSLIQGRTAGVTVTLASGEVGTASRIRIRGSNSVSLSNEPLVIVDGVRITSTEVTTVGSLQSVSRLNDINPEDIESIEILKGPAAAALYGTAAANGVIQITTKRGVAGAPRWNVYTEYTQIKDVTDYPASARADCYLVDVAEGDCDEVTGYIEFNPLETPGFSPFVDGRRRQVGLNVSGGTDAVTYYLGGDVEDEQGIYVTNSADRYNLRANLTTRLSDQLNFSFRSGYNRSDAALPQNDNNLYGYLLNGLLGSGDSTVSCGTYGICKAETEAFDAGQESSRFTASANANYRPLGWLSIVGTAGIDQVNRHDFETVGPNRIRPVVSGLIPIGYRESNRVEVTNLTGTADATATFDLRENLVSTTSVGTQYHGEEYHDTRAFGRGLAPGTESLGGTSQLFTVDENSTENVTIGVYGQQQLAINDRLFLTGALRADNNSAFGNEFGWVAYPSVSASWVLSDEPFFPSISALSNLRLRAAWGQSGLRPSFRDAITYYTPEAVRISGTDVSAVTVAGTGNADLRPEIATELELGFDLGLLNDRVGLELTYYNKESEDALVQRRLAPSLGLTTTRFENIGSVQNKGFEALLNARLLEQRNFQWDVTLSGSTTKNELVELGEGIDPIIMGGSRVQQRHQEGYPLGGYWGREVTFADANGDGLLQVSEVSLADSTTYMGTPFPTQEASLNTNVTLFNTVRVSGLLDYKGGHKQMNFTRFDRCSWEAICPAQFDRARTNLTDQAGLIAYYYLTNQENTTVYLEDSDFVKLREVSVSLMAPSRWTDRFNMSGLRLTVSGRNLYTWTEYSGFDPEVNGFGLTNFQTYDYYTTPPSRYLTARVDVNF